MTNIYLKKVAADTFVAVDEVSKEYISKIPFGSIRRVKITSPRNVKFHNKFFAMIDLVAQNQERIQFSTASQGRERMLYAISYLLGRGEFWGPDKQHFERDSISFASMGEEEFSLLYTEVIDCCLKNFVPMGREDFERELLSFG